MIVYLAVYGQYLLTVGREERLAPRLRIYDRQPLMGQDGRPASIDAAPVGTTVTNLLTHTQGLLTPFGRLLAKIENTYNSTHKNILSFKGY